MRVFEEIEAWGHPNVTARNRTTFEVTKEDQLTRRGDCIIAINASKGARDLNEELKKLVKREDAEITVIIEVGPYREMVKGKGNTGLTLNHATDLVIRKSNYICDRTLMVGADNVAIDFSRDMVKKLQKQSQKVIASLIVEV
ncbi:MAG: DUF371 domain-containing protein [Candidatus Bathyarchaeota archaeon]